MKSKKKRLLNSELSETTKNIIQLLLQKYEINNIHDIQNALKDLLGDTTKGSMKIKMKENFGHEKSAHSN